MKSFFIFIAGMITMLILMVGVYFYYNEEYDDIPGLTYLSEKQVGKTFEYKSVKILQAQSQNTALTWPNNQNEPAMFLIGKETDAFYDEQVIKIPPGYKLVQIGTYEYTNREKITKTVPAVAILK